MPEPGALALAEGTAIREAQEILAVTATESDTDVGTPPVGLVEPETSPVPTGIHGSANADPMPTVRDPAICAEAGLETTSREETPASASAQQASW